MSKKHLLFLFLIPLSHHFEANGRPSEDVRVVTSLRVQSVKNGANIKIFLDEKQLFQKIIAIFAADFSNEDSNHIGSYISELPPRQTNGPNK